MQRGDAAGTAATAWEPSPCPTPEGDSIREWQISPRGTRKYRRGLAVWGSPALAVIDDRPMVFIGGCDQTLHALDLLAKEERWAKITNGDIGDAPAIGDLDGRSVVFWGSSDRFVYAHDARDGRRVWTHELVPPSPTLGGVETTAPLLHGGILYLGVFVYDKSMARNDQKGWLFALDMRTGRELWRFEASQGPVGAPVGMILPDGRFRLFLAARRGQVLALDPAPAGPPATAWSAQMPHEVLGSPALFAADGVPMLILGSKFGALHAYDARTGQPLWKRMTGNWIDNNACAGLVDGAPRIFFGSHDYQFYCLDARTGDTLWRRGLGGEIYSAPCLFPGPDGQPLVAAAALDNHLYVMDARTGRVETSYFTGNPGWDKVTKGETLWGSPAAFAAGPQTALVHGSMDGNVYVLPIAGEVSLRAQVRSAATLWKSLAVTALLFGGVILPVLLRVTRPAVSRLPATPDSFR